MNDKATAQFLPVGAGESLNVVGESIRVLADGRASGGRAFIFEETSPAGMGPPLHRHTHDDEFFYILAGRYRFVCDGKEFIANPGAFVCAPKGSTHTFVSCNPDGGVSKMLVICTPPGLEGPFRECTAGGPSMPMDAILAAFTKFDLEFVGPPLKA